MMKQHITQILIAVSWLAACVSPAPCASGKCNSGYMCILGNCVLNVTCPFGTKYGSGPPAICAVQPTDPLNMPKSKLEEWFTKEIFNDLFPRANIGWGPNKCRPYSYESFIIAARYFPRFGTEAPSNGLSAKENHYRDLAAFFAHAIQETGENDASLYTSGLSKEEAHACFYRGGFFNWFEGGPTSMLLPPGKPGHDPTDGDKCVVNGRYCDSSRQSNLFYKCSDQMDGSYYKGCYFGRGAIQLSYNFNYGPFNRWLNQNGIEVDLLNNPNLLMTKMDPPLAVMGSMWFYMTPQPPKPAMHDIVIGAWEPGEVNRRAGYSGPIFGPTSLIINNECGGEDAANPGGPGESRRIKAFKWFTSYFGVPAGRESTLSCKDMPQKLNEIAHNMSYQPDWTSLWKNRSCECTPSPSGGPIGYYQPKFYPEVWVEKNKENKDWCEGLIYKNPEAFGVPQSSACLKFPRSDASPAEGTTGSKLFPASATGGGGGTHRCPSPNGNFLYPNDCTRFITCSRGTPTILQCSTGLHFNKKTGSCDWPSSAKCKSQ